MPWGNTIGQEKSKTCFSVSSTHQVWRQKRHKDVRGRKRNKKNQVCHVINCAKYYSAETGKRKSNIQHFKEGDGDGDRGGGVERPKAESEDLTNLTSVS